ncbi:MAG: Ppx/GppA family phosphatase [Beijerinckiaceae bacterium]|nr:Ppx/GppA family phosphatase [Beijerinckiaceae bacterium]
MEGDAASSVAICPLDSGEPLRTGAVPGRPFARRDKYNGAAGALSRWPSAEPTYAALDLGTNNCRLLIARPAPAGRGQDGFRVIDSFSRIVRLGEGLLGTGELSAAAIERTLSALAVCRDKMRARGVTHSRLIATEACRAARNGAEFLDRVREESGLELEVVDRETEARLAALGSASLADSAAEGVVLFDIGGGSSELVWLARGANGDARAADSELGERVRFWVSLKIGVVTLAEQFGGVEVSESAFAAMTDYAGREIMDFASRADRERRCRLFHLLGTSGTVTTIAGIYLGLARYDRRRVDGLWMSRGQVDLAVTRLRQMTYQERAANGCIGQGRADLVLAGCAILEAIRRAFPADRIRIADRGLRDGMLIQLMRADRGGAAG